jgi:SRSO17 transposase
MARKRPADEARFSEYLDLLSSAVGHADRREPLRAYLTGLLLPGERKSVEPMAAKVDPRHAPARHQSMHHFVAVAPWDEVEVLRVARDYALGQMERHAPVLAYVVDDTTFPKKGTHSVGVARQYCGVLGKQDNCQAVVTISMASAGMSVPAAYRLYLPEPWAKDPARRKAAGVPDDVRFRTKGEIALEALEELIAEDLPPAPVVADAGYGMSTDFRDRLTERGIPYGVGIPGETTVWPPGVEPLPVPPRTGIGRPRKLLRRDPEHRPVSARALALSLPDGAWQTVRWREGTHGAMKSRFARLRVRAAHRDYWRERLRDPEWLLIEWPQDEKEPTKFWLATVAEDAPLDETIRLVKVRWRVERDYQEMKDELGLDHYEGRGWRGFHHHGALVIAAYAFLAAERARLSPPEPLAFLAAVPLPKDFRPRGSPPPRAA